MSERSISFALFSVRAHDGLELDSEHDDIIARAHEDALELEALNELLFNCTRPARATTVPPEDPDHDADLALLRRAAKKS